VTVDNVMPGVVARWTSPQDITCDECAMAVAVACAECGQRFADRPVGMLASVVDTPAGPQLVIARRDESGNWTPIRRVPATTSNVRALARPGATGPGHPLSETGGLL
jgi:hypothetical protein